MYVPCQVATRPRADVVIEDVDVVPKSCGVAPVRVSLVDFERGIYVAGEDDALQCNVFFFT